MQVPEQTLTRVAQEVLETMAFVLVMPGEEEFADVDNLVRAVVRFEGPFSGSVCLLVPYAVVPELTANMVGQDDGSPCSEQQQFDAVGELANVMCGNLVQVLAGPQPVFKLYSPELSAGPVTPEPPAPGVSITKVRVPLENGWAELSLALSPEGAKAASEPAVVGLQ